MTARLIIIERKITLIYAEIEVANVTSYWREMARVHVTLYRAMCQPGIEVTRMRETIKLGALFSQIHWFPSRALQVKVKLFCTHKSNK